MTMAPKTPRAGQKPDRSQEQPRIAPKVHEAVGAPHGNLRSKSASPQRQAPFQDTFGDQTAQTSRPATNPSQGSDRGHIGAPSEIPVPSRV